MAVIMTPTRINPSRRITMGMRRENDCVRYTSTSWGFRKAMYTESRVKINSSTICFKVTVIFVVFRLLTFFTDLGRRIIPRNSGRSIPEFAENFLSGFHDIQEISAFQGYPELVIFDHCLHRRGMSKDSAWNQANSALKGFFNNLLEVALKVFFRIIFP